VPVHRAPSLALALVTAALATGCAGSNDESRHANEHVQAFLAAMAPHHESAIEMAGVASKRAAHPELRQLADTIVAVQQGEIAKIANIHMRLTGERLRPNADAHRQLGLSAEEAGMMHDGSHAVAGLKRAKNFDRAFIDAMVPHHQGAIRMARSVLPVSKDAELRRFAERIVTTQRREIEQMRRWRAAWDEGPSPAGRVPESRSKGAERMHRPAHESRELNGSERDPRALNGSERERGGARERR
jgi:uncharacterized protein (DUF305 family)